ncbi:MAG: hypothetical protein LBI85_06110 [Spirochaetaceae bacterium]|jgi:hypothetical protein|nr:hypothetical protein [Spirochaetaceae bacterium]
MSDNAATPSGSVKEWGVIAAWIGGILLLNTLLWVFTGAVREERFIQTVNRSLSETNDPRRIRKIQDKKAAPSGAFAHWYELEDGTGKAAVFSVLSGGVPASCLATVSQDGKVTGIIPLSGHSARVLEAMPQSILGIYRRKLESGGTQ